MIQPLHDDELDIDVELVRNLIDSEFPQYNQLPLSQLSVSGSTNILYRLGDELLVRLPRQPGAGRVIDKEHQWLPYIQSRLKIAIPEFVAVGQPAFGFPERWSIVRWLDGEMPEPCLPHQDSKVDTILLAKDLADVILDLRKIEVRDNARVDKSLRGYRGRSLQEFDRATRYCIKQCRLIKGLDLDLDAALEVWTRSLSLPGASESAADCWYHGDLVCENLLLVNGKLDAVLDFGGLSIGDPTIDLHGAWELFDRRAREVFRHRLGVDEAQWLRGRAWALGIAIGTFYYYWDKMPNRMRCRLAMAQSVLAEATGEQ